MKRALKWGIVVVAAIAGCLLVATCNSRSVVADNYMDGLKSEAAIETKYAAMGPCQVTSVAMSCPEPKYKQYLIYYPADVATSARTYPLVIMANGTGVPASRYAKIFEHLASWGFIVAGNEDPESWSGKSSSMTLDFMLAQNTDATSIFKGKINTEKMGIAGHSQGGVAVYNAITEFNNGKGYDAAYIASCTHIMLAQGLKWNYFPKKLGVPSLFTAGTGKWDDETISPLASLRFNMAAMQDGTPGVIARRTGKDHGEILAEGDAYMTAWFCYWLKGDSIAGKAFIGDDAEIMHNKRWQDVDSQNL
ncbi:MAG: hypothetical protein ACI4AH_06660 [Muribaculaceae bacterium]